MANSNFYAVCPLGLEELLATELKECGARDIKTVRGGLHFSGSMATAMRACLTSRIASRILMRLASSDYYDEEDVYNFACRTKWETWFGPDKSIRVDVNSHRSPLKSLDFTLLRIKDGICDRFMHFMNVRPDVDRARPQIRVFAYLDERYCTFYLDLCGEALFKRGWRRDKGEAPLKENLAAGLLRLAGWTPDQPLVDPFCGSGTIAIEAAQIACNMAPGLNRRFLFENFSTFERDVWEEILDDARMAVNRHAKVRIAASDISSIVVQKARENALQAGLSNLIDRGDLTFAQGDARAALPVAESGLVIANPPYGEQSNPKSASVASMMKNVSDNLKRNFAGWTAWLLTSDRTLPRQMRLKESRKIPLFNGPLECRFFRFDLVSGSFRKDAPAESDAK
ncbi:MAG: THUMP domain-containing protein [Duodenibacillus sp.]|nr:THUMP domain-containing protein [Duodenibacillus sp.]